MPLSRYEHSPEIKAEIIKTLSSEIDFLHAQIKKLNKENNLFVEAIDLSNKYNIGLEDKLQTLRNIFNFIAIQAYEVNIVLKKMILSDCEVDDIPLIKQGVTILQEGCKRLIGFYFIKNGQTNDSMVKESLLHKIHDKVKIDYPDLYSSFEKVIDDFRNKLESKNIKDIRCELIHYQNDKGDFNSFNFSNTVLNINCDDVYDLLFDYHLFLKLIAGYMNGLMNMGYR